MFKNLKLVRPPVFEKPNTFLQTSKKVFTKETGTRLLNAMQRLGKTLQFPIAVLPFAAILNRFGALGMAYAPLATNPVGYWISHIIQIPGGIIFSDLPLFFAIGCGFGLAKDNRGEASLAAVAFYVVTVALTKEHSLPEMIYGHMKAGAGMFLRDPQGNLTTHLKLYYAFRGGKLAYVLDIGVVGGIVAGCFTAFLYNRTKNIQLPQVLSFFGGRRFVPMLAIAVAVPTAFIYAIIWPWVQYGLTQFGNAISGSGAAAVGGAFAYGVLNRILLPFGMHQILNIFLWFQLPITGQHIAPGTGAVLNNGANLTVNGDINAFTAGIFGSGNFQSGYFPIMMGGLPAAVIAMIYTARKENRQAVAGFLAGAAGISFLTGITEPIEFTFVFLSPVLWLAHAFLTGISNAVVIGMHIHVGFGFSSGFIDYVISFAQSWGFANHEGFVNGSAFKVLSNPLWIFLLSAIFFALYFVTFSWIIKKMNIQTPGREENYVAPIRKTKNKGSKSKKVSKYETIAKTIIEAISAENIAAVSNCATRLRIQLASKDVKVDEEKIKGCGVYGLTRVGDKSLQIVIGPDVEHVTDIVKEILKL